MRQFPCCGLSHTSTVLSLFAFRLLLVIGEVRDYCNFVT